MDTATVSDVVPTDRWEITDRSGIMITGTRAAKTLRLRQLWRGRLYRGRLAISVAGAPTAGWSVRVRSRKSHEFRYQTNQTGCGIAVRYAVGPEPGELEQAKTRFVV